MSEEVNRGVFVEPGRVDCTLELKTCSNVSGDLRLPRRPALKASLACPLTPLKTLLAALRKVEAVKAVVLLVRESSIPPLLSAQRIEGVVGEL